MNSVLIIDDDRSVRSLLRSILQKKGFKTRECADGTSGLEETVGYRPDIVLLDLLLPDMHGLEVLDKLQKAPVTRAIPVIVLTGSTDQENRLSALRSGAVDYIEKPFVAEEVTLRVTTQLRIHDLIKSLQTAVQGLEDDLKAAGTIQRALVPSEVPAGIEDEIRWIYLPSSSVGGDIFDIIPLNDHSYLVYVLDVSGHGVNAALISVMVHRFIEDFRSSRPGDREPFSLKEFMRSLDRNFQFERFETYMTATCVIADLQKGEIEVSNAGNPFPLLLERKYTQRLDRDNNGAIGFGMVKGSTSVHKISEETRLFLFTDGIVDVRTCEGTRLGEKTIADLAESTRHMELDDAFSKYQALLGESLPGAQTSFEDDVTFVAIQF